MRAPAGIGQKGLVHPLVRRTLLVTNDFPPRAGGIQSYLLALAQRLPADRLVVYAPSWPDAAEFDARQAFPIFRHPGSLMLPGDAVRARAAELIREHRIGAVWYGAAAPLGLLTPALRAEGISRTVACTHGHEVGWSMLPGARRALRRIGCTNDVLTFVSRYARRRISAALGPTAALEYLPPGVLADIYRPDPQARRVIRERYGIGDAPLVLSVSRLVARKGQDALLRAVARVRRTTPDVRILIVGDGPDRGRLASLIGRLELERQVLLAGSVPWADLPAHYAAADVFAMPCRTRGFGLDVEGLGLVFLEASASGLPVVAGRSGGAPETVLEGRTGMVVDGRNIAELAHAIGGLLADPDRATVWGADGRDWVRRAWNWQSSADRLAGLLSG